MKFERVTLPEQPYMYVERACPMAEIGQHMGTAFTELFDFFARHGIQPQGGPMAVYPSMPSADTVRFRCGALVRAEDLGKGERMVQGGTLPEGPAMKTVHVGPYSTLNQTHGALWDHITEEDLDAAMPVWEIYIDDPQKTPEGDLRTEVYRALSDGR